MKWYVLLLLLSSCFTEIDEQMSLRFIQSLNKKNDLLRTWSAGSGPPFLLGELNGEIGAIFYDAIWGAKPYRALVHDRDEVPGRQVTTLWESADGGIPFTKHSKVFDTGDTYCWVGTALWDGSKYLMAYTGPAGGTNEQVGFATSLDLITWVDFGYILKPGVLPVPSIERIFGNGLIFENSRYWLTVSESPDHTQEYYRIALYKSAVNDFTSWERIGTILDIGTSGEWDDVAVFAPNFVKNQNKYIIYYAGQDEIVGYDRRIGIAYSRNIEGPYTKFHLNPILDDNALIQVPTLFDDPVLNKWRLYYKYRYSGEWRQKEAT